MLHHKNHMNTFLCFGQKMFINNVFSLFSKNLRFLNVENLERAAVPIRMMAYVSNKRITRIFSEVRCDKSDLKQEGNESYIDVSLKNRNPRNLEQMLFEPKPMGFEMDQPNRHWWNKIVFEKKSNYLLGKIVHHSGKTLVTATTNEPSLAVFLVTSKTDTRAATILGQVLAMRTLESGIHSVFCDIEFENRDSKKYSFFVKSFQDSGVNLNEQNFIVARAQRDL